MPVLGGVRLKGHAGRSAVSARSQPAHAARAAANGSNHAAPRVLFSRRNSQNRVAFPSGKHSALRALAVPVFGRRHARDSNFRRFRIGSASAFAMEARHCREAVGTDPDVRRPARQCTEIQRRTDMSGRFVGRAPPRQNLSKYLQYLDKLLADRVRFELTKPVKVLRISSAVPSTTRPPVRGGPDTEPRTG
jgi:hypothetical protein